SSRFGAGNLDMRLVLTSTGKLLISLTMAEWHLGQSGSSANEKLARIQPLQSSRVQDQTGVIASGSSSNVFLREYMPLPPIIGSLRSKLSPLQGVCGANSHRFREFAEQTLTASGSLRSKLSLLSLP